MLTIKQGIRLSAIVDKLELEIKDPTASKEQVGADLMMQIVTKVHKAEKEIYAFVADLKKITVQEAEDIDLIEFVKEIATDSGAMGFFKSAVKSSAQG